MEWILRQRFRAMLLALVMALVVSPVLDEFAFTRFTLDILRTLVFVTAFVIIFKEKRHRLLAIALAIPTVLGGWSIAYFDEKPLPAFEACFHLIAAIFLAFTVAAILRAVYCDADVTSDNIYGAFCGYLLVGVIFGHCYCIAEALAPGSFSMSDEVANQFQNNPRNRYVLFYFSMITFTTVGYGDITPAAAATRGLAMLEAVAGQFYIAVLVAELIGKRVSQPAASPKPQDPNL